MIGNSNNLLRLQKHFKKMFAGVHALIINEDDQTLIEGIQSKEGEKVKFFNQISIKQYPNINDWLTRVEKEISLTLAKLLAQSIPQLITIQNNLNDTQAFINWLDQYQVYAEFFKRFLRLLFIRLN
jgi:dynein heavy chain 1